MSQDCIALIFKKILRSGIIPLITCIFHQAYAGEISVPSFGHGREDFSREFISPDRNECEALFKQHQTDVKNVIQAANEHFKRRGWSDEFLVERFKVAEKFDAQSEYYLIRKKDTQEIVATIGITIAEYSQGKVEQMIPVEDTLKVFPLARPLDSSGHGFIAELRTYSIDRAFHFEAYPELLSIFFEHFYQRLQDYPELYKKPILYTYADETSLKMYGMMGFKKISETPIVHEKSNWWVMATSPQTLERVGKRVQNPYLVQGFNQPIEVRLQNGRPAILKAGGLVLNQKYLRSQNAPFSQLVSEIHEPVEVVPGIWADRGASVTWFENGQLASITKVANEVVLPEGLVVKAGGQIVFTPEGRISQIDGLGEQAKVAPGVVAAKHSRVVWYTDGRLHSVSELASESQVAPGIFASKGARVAWQLPDAHISYVSRLSRASDIDGNIIAAKGAEVSWAIDWSKRKIVVNQVSKIAKTCELAPNIWAASGSSFYFNHNPKQTPAVSILAGPVATKNQIFKAGDFLSYGLTLKRPRPPVK